ncbi:ring finger protein 112, partial [Chelydra serpentina]
PRAGGRGGGRGRVFGSGAPAVWGTRVCVPDAGVLFPPADVDEEFRRYLRDYVSAVAGSAGTHVRTDRAGQALTGARLAARIKAVSRYLKTKHYDFSSPVKMAETFAAMRQEVNSRAVEATRREYKQFVQEQQDRAHQSWSSLLRVKPAEMQRRLEEKRWDLLVRCQEEMWGEDPQKQAALDELEQKVDKQMDEFLLDYKERFQVAKTEEENSKAVEAKRMKFGKFVQWLKRAHQKMRRCLRVKPAEMKQPLETKKEFLKLCWGKLQGKDSQKQAALKELEKGLNKQTAQFLPSYEQRFKKKAKQLGLAVGCVLVVVAAGVGAGIGLGVTAAVVGLEEAVAIGIGAGSLGLFGGGVGGSVWACFRRKAAW